MSAYPPSFRISQALGLAGAAWLSGSITSLSLLTIPSLLASHSTHTISLATLTQQFRLVYEYGKQRMPPVALLTATNFLYLAWSVRPGTALAVLAPRHSAVGYAVAVALTVGIVPWTAAAMGRVNAGLLGWEESVDGKREGEEERVVGLLRRWGWLNVGRGLLPLLGGLVSVVAGV
ncbi:DUF1772-domain-containing protein [Aspergillus ellipticus CBS 707.79]|uniref:DUF1772-domain-containing protein n=1 Tax=Aspergillus ellipticus CBS 707.79 TaxID=1448320 RepID=A0A319CUD5_9EURO|nr:DUF1772-domain-containing protein [Aspergillus ellipticus CBS 707.79]